LGDAASAVLEREGYAWPFEALLPLLAGGDALVINLEGPVTASTEPFVKQKWSYNAAPASVQGLVHAGVGWAGLANNHAMDRGPEGLEDTREHLAAAGIGSFGAGVSREEALTPALLESPHGRIGVVGFAERYAPAVMATKNRAGVVALTERRAHQAAEAGRAAGVDHLVAFVHWGENYEGVRPLQRRMAGWLVDAGFDLVVGHGAHLQQEVEVSCGVPIVYSIGNLVFGTPGRFSEQAPGHGVVLRTEFGASGVQAIEAQCILTDNTEVKFQPRPCGAEAASRVLGSFLEGAVVSGNHARLEL